jgi:predicted aspartyl protease
VRKFLIAALIAAGMTTTVQAKAETFKDTRDIAKWACDNMSKESDVKWCEGAAAGVYVVTKNDDSNDQMNAEICHAMLDTVVEMANPVYFVVQVASASGGYASCEIGPWPKVTVDYDSKDGIFTAKGTVDGNPTKFIIDTGASVSVLNRKFAASLDPLTKIGSIPVTLADGTIVTKTVYEAHNVCLGGICADKLEVILGDADNFLGVNFLGAARVSLAITSNGVMTLTGY